MAGGCPLGDWVGEMEPSPPSRHQACRRALPRARSVLVVCAHPDDESFGLGAVVASLTATGTGLRVVCFTHGEASTLGSEDRPLVQVRGEELASAASLLGVGEVVLLDYPDGGLGAVPRAELAGHVLSRSQGVDLLLVFDEGGITGHPDHTAATNAALAAATVLGLPVLAWALPGHVAASLNEEFGTQFAGRERDQLNFEILVDRARQRQAIACHVSQSRDNPVLWRRLQLLGDEEHLRWLRPPASQPPRYSPTGTDDTARSGLVTGDACSSRVWSAADNGSLEEAR